MATHYAVIECSNPAGAESTSYACCRAIMREPLTLADLTESIMQATTYTKADVVGVLTACREYCKQHLLEGQSLRFGELGILSPRIKSRCFPQAAISADDFDPSSYIEKVDVDFRISNEIKSFVRVNMRLERVPSTLLESSLRDARKAMRAKLDAENAEKAGAE